MTGGDSRSLFVVQRAFRRVRRGYDPEEVDRHLQLVSEWFASGRGGRTAREAEQQLLARERAAVEAEEAARKELEGERVEAEATLEGARLRAKGDIEAAGREAARIVTDARAEAQKILDGARVERDRVLAELLADAEAHAAARREELDNELRGYEDRRRREADRLVEAARRERFGPDAYSP